MIIPELSRSIASMNPARWLVVFGPGAIIASLTIGTGELVFSSRAGSIFGYRILWLFLLTCILKWVLVFTLARHMVVSGRHPFERFARLPGPVGWFPILMLLLAALAFPIWIGFLGGVLGTLASEFLSIDSHFWAVLLIFASLTLVLRGGYSLLERIQLIIVFLLLLAAALSLILVGTDWTALIKGFLVPSTPEYPVWIQESYPSIAEKPVWLEAATYVGVIGGSAYDYLAYVSFLRHKNWGLSGQMMSDSRHQTPQMKRRQISNSDEKVLRKWVRAPAVDCTLSFLVVLVFSTVFVALGRVILAPQHQIPDGTNLLGLQAQFVTGLHPMLLPLYLVGAALALIGTLYATIAVAPAILREVVIALDFKNFKPNSLDRWAVLWSGFGGIAVLVWRFTYRFFGGEGSDPPSLIEIVTPANLFTGVLACGFICLLFPWLDSRYLPTALKMPGLLLFLNLFAGIFFVFLGIRGYWDYAVQRFPNWGSGWFGVIGLVLTLGFGWCAAWLLQKFRNSESSIQKKGLRDQNPE